MELGDIQVNGRSEMVVNNEGQEDRVSRLPDAQLSELHA
jgi:hypothetical protein